jgi:serine phosphatase RsbU (regulator of sigma subunit)
LGICGYSIHFTLGPLPIDLFQWALILLDLAIAVMLFRRAWRAWKESSSLRAELEAAREVQEQLVAPAVSLPGFQIESLYAPARQVGGDFFRVTPQGDGAVLVIVGDVSGKGLKAAMTVSAIMGALRGCGFASPAQVLEYLNSVLFGQIGGFVTCCVARIAADGAMTLANAGNPAPYCNGKEMAVEAGLPLGVVSEAGYAETRCQLAAGARLTFVSDGVLEATNSSGELFGFDRTAALSTKTASEIAKAAEQFGQEDDITVLTISRAVAGGLSAP